CRSRRRRSSPAPGPWRRNSALPLDGPSRQWVIGGRVGACRRLTPLLVPRRFAPTRKTPGRGCAAWGAVLCPTPGSGEGVGAGRMSWLWAVFTVAASGGQVQRNAMQKELTATLGMVGATQVRFLFGLPFALAVLAIVLATAPLPWPELNTMTIAWTVTGAIAQIGGTALLLAVMQQRSFVVTTAYVKTELVQVAVFGLIFLGDQVTPGLA